MMPTNQKPNKVVCDGYSYSEENRTFGHDGKEITAPAAVSADGYTYRERGVLYGHDRKAIPAQLAL